MSLASIRDNVGQVETYQTSTYHGVQSRLCRLSNTEADSLENDNTHQTISSLAHSKLHPPLLSTSHITHAAPWCAPIAIPNVGRASVSVNGAPGFPASFLTRGSQPCRSCGLSFFGFSFRADNGIILSCAGDLELLVGCVARSSGSSPLREPKHILPERTIGVCVSRSAYGLERRKLRSW